MKFTISYWKNHDVEMALEVWFPFYYGLNLVFYVLGHNKKIDVSRTFAKKASNCYAFLS